MFPRKGSEDKRQKELEDRIDRLIESNIPVHYHPKERREKMERYRTPSRQRKFQTRRIFSIMVLLAGFIYLAIFIVQKKNKNASTSITQLNQSLNTQFSWSKASSPASKPLYHLVIRLTLKPNLGVDQVKIGRNVAFDLLLFDSLNQKIFSQKLISQEKIIDAQNPLLLQSAPISQTIKDNSVQIELAIESYLNEKMVPQSTILPTTNR